MRVKVPKISKGYRLKPETHKLISILQARLKTDADSVISAACRKLHKEIKNNFNILK